MGSAGNDVDFRRCKDGSSSWNIADSSNPQIRSHSVSTSPIMNTSPARDADTLRFTLCEDQDMGDLLMELQCSETDHEASLRWAVWAVQIKSGIRNGHCADVGQRYRVNQEPYILVLLQPVHGAVSVGEVLDHGSGTRDGSGNRALQSRGRPSLTWPTLARDPRQRPCSQLPLAAPSPRPRWLPHSCPNIVPAAL